MTEILEKHEVLEDAPIAQIITDDFIVRFERAADLYQHRYLPLCLRLTNEADWILQGDRYYLQASGAEKICNPLGIVWDRPAVVRHEREDDHGKFYEYEVEGIIQSRVLRRWGWFTGNCTSRDQFFNARPGWTPMDGEGDIRKSAFSNWLVNAITRLAGIRNPTPVMLEKAGLHPDRIGKVDYSGRRTPEQDAGVISDAQRKRLWAIARQRTVDESTISKYLKERYKIESTNQIARRDYDAIVAWVDRGGKDAEPVASGATH